MAGGRIRGGGGVRRGAARGLRWKSAAKETTVDGIFPIIRAALSLVAAGAVIVFALARRKRTVTSLGLWAPAAAPPCGPKPETTRQAS
jgi:hypothetical protein